MRYFLIAGGAILGILLLHFFVRSRIDPRYSVRPRDARRVLERLREARAEPAFAVMIFTTADRPGVDDGLKLQYSLESGRCGLDWVRKGRRNVEDEARFVAFARDRGFVPIEREMNGQKYLRIEEGDIAKLAEDVMTVLYGVRDDADVELLVEGMIWNA